jgi:penicillin-binding protein 1C
MRLTWLIGLVAGIIFLAAIADRSIFPLPVNRLTKDHAYFIYGRDGSLLCSFASTDHFWRKPVTLGGISPTLVATVLACEDRWFRYHPGFNPVSLLLAAIDNIKAGEIVRGGSTITMQIARMMEPKPRTITNKIIEILRAVQLELHYSKDELLEIYFNLAPYGGNIEGIGAATHFYFGKSPDRLSISETAILTAIPASPNKYRPDRNPTTCRDRRNVLLTLLYNAGEISEIDYNEALEEEMPTHRSTRPFIAPHFCQSMINQYSGLSEIHTTIDLSIQTMAEQLSRDHLASLRAKGIHNLAVVVIDNTTGELLALVGSPDFNDTRHSGQINGATAIRSPGSALKPFVYALGFETGKITPATKIDDIPVSYAGYSPENYDEEYHGLVSAQDALIQSLNVPAVNVTADIGLKEYYDLLLAAGISSLDKQYFEYGLPLVLGGCEVSLLELSNLYSMLANGGWYRPIRKSTESDTTQSRQILSDEACYITSSILANLERPELTSSWEFTKDLPTIAWKTGTSYGRKDAWTIGYNPAYTVGVWAGNFSGEGSPYLVGVETAAPLMLAIFREISIGQEIKWYEIPDGVAVRNICTVSGMLPDENCPTTRDELYIRYNSPANRCSVHKRIIIDQKKNHMLCRACAHGKNADTITVEQARG